MAAKNSFWEKSPDDSADILGVKIFVEVTILHCFREKCFLVFYVEFPDGRQKWWEKDY